MAQLEENRVLRLRSACVAQAPGEPLPGAFFPRNQIGGVLFRLYTGSALHFPSFCCHPSPILASPPRIDSSRRETANGALKPGIGLHLGNPISRSSSLGTPPTTQKSHPAPRLLCTLGARFDPPWPHGLHFRPLESIQLVERPPTVPSNPRPLGISGYWTPST